MNVLIRCDGSSEIGLGHIVRCLALADELSKTYGCRIAFAMRQSKAGMDIVRKKYPVLESGEESLDYEKWLSECIITTDAEVLIFDTRDNLDRSVVEKCKQRFNVLVADVDDPEDKRLAADLAFYPPVPQVKRMSWEDFNGILYSGWEYIILREQFTREYPEQVNKIPLALITMGGSDPNNLTLKIVNALQSIEVPVRLRILIGAGFDYKQIEELLSTGFDNKPEIISDCPDVARVMSEANLAIATFGVTAYELASLGVPCLYIYLTGDHRESASIFVSDGYGEDLGWYNEIEPGLIRSIVARKLEELQLMKKNNLKKNERIASGTKRIARIITERRLHSE